MNKPEKHTRTFYDYNECCKYIEDKYGIDTRNFAGKTFGGDNDDAPYQDFWHHLCDSVEMHNGCYFFMSDEAIDEEYGVQEEWIRTIYEYFLSEFGEGTDREIEFYVWW
jgi:hypothetical protein